MRWTFCCSRAGACEVGKCFGTDTPQITVKRRERTPAVACKAEAAVFFGSPDGLGHMQVEVTVEDDD